MHAVVRRGLLDHRRAPLIWGTALGAMTALITAIWPSVQGSLDQLTAVAILAVRAIAGTVTTPEERGWLDTILTAPVRRSTVVAGGFVVSAVVVAEVLAIITALTWAAGTVAGADPSLVVLARGMANVWPLALFFGGLAALAAGRVHRSAPVTAIATGILVAMYLLDLVGKLADDLAWLRWASIFRYTGSAIQHGIDPLAFAALSVLGAAMAAAGALLLERRDVL